MNAGHQIVFTCKSCGARETFFAPMRSMLVMLLDRSMWHSGRDEGTSVCVNCHGEATNYATNNAKQYEQQAREERAARKAFRAKRQAL
jgi:hypothetical protein